MKYLIAILFFICFSQATAETIKIPKNNKILFDIIRKNKTIGSHIINFKKENGILNVDIKVDIKVKLGFITLYKYSHENNENWEKSELISISTKSLTNSKKKYIVNGEQKNDKFEFYGIDGRNIVERNVVPISYWNVNLLKRKNFLDTQKGIIREFTLSQLDSEKIIFDNNEVECIKYEIKIITKHSSDEKPFPIIYVWYDNNGELMKLFFNSPEDNSKIDYVRIK